MTLRDESNVETIPCRRPLVRVLGSAAYCNYCGAERGEPCRLLTGRIDAEIRGTDATE